jgi:hypothetical protein
MKTNIRKIFSLIAMFAFLTALGINIQVSKDDPFEMVNEKALAEETTNKRYTLTQTECYKAMNCVVDGELQAVITWGTRGTCTLDPNGSDTCGAFYCTAPDPDCELP